MQSIVVLSLFLHTYCPSLYPLFLFLFNPPSFPSSLPSSLPPSDSTPYPAYSSSTIFPTVAGGNLKYWSICFLLNWVP